MLYAGQRRLAMALAAIGQHKATAVWILLMAVALSPAAPSRVAPTVAAEGSTWYVATTGKASNPGTFAAPLDLATALDKGSPARPGDTIWVRGGTYKGGFISYLTGTAAAPIVVRQYQGERVTIDATNTAADGLYVNGAWTWYWGFEIMSAAPLRDSKAGWALDILRGTGITSHAPGAKFINMVIHDMKIGVGIWISSPDSEVYGSIIYNNGYDDSARGHGHGIYAQNKTGVQRLTDNILFGGYSHGIHAYGSPEAFLNNIQVEGNLVFNSGMLSTWSNSFANYVERNILVGGGRKAENPVVNNNMTYYSPGFRGGDNNIGYNGGCSNVQARGNYWAHAAQYPLAIRADCVGDVRDNVMIGAVSDTTKALFPNNTFIRNAPTGLKGFVRPNRFEVGRAHIVVYNWDKLPQVEVNISAIGLKPGDAFEVRDVQDYYAAPVVVGVYSDGKVRIPMAARSVAPPLGNARRFPQHTGPLFGAFVIMKTAGAAAPVPTPELSAVLEGATSPAIAGQRLSFTVAVANTGTAAAGNVSLDVNLAPAAQGTTYSATQGSCSANTIPACTLGTLAPGARASVRVEVTPLAGPLSITASVASNGTDSNPADNTAKKTITIETPAPTPPPVPPVPVPPVPVPPVPVPSVPVPSVPVPSVPVPPVPPVTGTGNNLSLTQELQYPNGPGGAILLKLLVRNTAATAHPTVRLTSMLRAQPWVILGVSGTTSQGKCSGTYPVTCDVGTLAPGGTAAITVTVVPRLAGTFTNLAQVAGGLAETNLTDNAIALPAALTKK